jgi:hypothetical protein
MFGALLSLLQFLPFVFLIRPDVICMLLCFPNPDMTPPNAETISPIPNVEMILITGMESFTPTGLHIVWKFHQLIKHVSLH